MKALYLGTKYLFPSAEPILHMFTIERLTVGFSLPIVTAHLFQKDSPPA